MEMERRLNQAYDKVGQGRAGGGRAAVWQAVAAATCAALLSSWRAHRGLRAWLQLCKALAATVTHHCPHTRHRQRTTVSACATAFADGC